MATLAAKVATVYQETGPVGLASRVVHKLAAPVVEWGGITFFVRDLVHVPPGVDIVRGVRCREASLADLEALQDGGDPTQGPAELARRFRRGDRGFVAFDGDGRVAHVRWVTTTRAYIPEIDRDVDLAPHQAYFYNGHTREDMRGRGIDGVIRNLIFATLGGNGFAEVYSYVRGDNPVGLRAASRWQRPVGTVWYVRIGRRRPIVFGPARQAMPKLVKPSTRSDADADRAQAFRGWFRSWIDQPLSRRSTGCAAISDADFESSARFIDATLAFDPATDVVLDVGCDSAMISRLIAPRTRRFVGLDFIPEMLRDARDHRVRVDAGRPPSFVAGDACGLPLRSRAFTKVYCSAVIHTLPSRAHGLAAIDELIRVTAPGGRVLVASVPDRARRRAARMWVWKQASWIEKITFPIRWSTPASVRRLARRVLRRRSTGLPEFLDYDLRALRERLEARGLVCEIREFPADYWNSEFRASRANLLISVPAARAAA